MHSGDSSSASNNILQSAYSLDRVDGSKSNTQPSEWTNRIYSLGISQRCFGHITRLDGGVGAASSRLIDTVQRIPSRWQSIRSLATVHDETDAILQLWNSIFDTSVAQLWNHDNKAQWKVKRTCCRASLDGRWI